MLKKYLFIYLLGLVLIGNFLFNKLACAKQPQDATVYYQKFVKIAELLQYIQLKYVDTVNAEQLTNQTITAMLEQLDPHSSYITKEDVKAENEPLEGSFEGIGITFNIFHDTLMVTSAVPNAPAEKVGLKAGDRIIYVNDTVIANVKLTNKRVFSLLRGPKGSVVNLKVLRSGHKGLSDFRIVRDKIPIYSLDAAFMANQETAYIKLNRFSATTSSEFSEALAKLRANGSFSSLILDLRGNGGGYLSAAALLADEFLPNQHNIVYTKGASTNKEYLNASPMGSLENTKLVVLIDESSASASEIVAGAIQDWDRGVVIGRRSFGKGLVQDRFFFKDSSELRLTTAYYYMPSGRCIQKPYNKGIKEYQNDYLERFENGELFSKDSVRLTDSVKYYTLVNKRVVYGGGGVMPDLFVPIDTSNKYKYYNELWQKNVFYDFVLARVDAQRLTLKKQYPNFKAFNTNFVITDKLIDELAEAGAKAGIPKDSLKINAVAPLIRQRMKSLFARELFSLNEFYQVHLEEDEAFKKALETLQNNALYNKILGITKPE